MTQSGSKPYKTVTSRTVFSCPWYRIRQDEIITPDGGSGVYNVVEKEDAVWVVPVTPSLEIVLIHHYRYTVDDWCWELPAGSQEPGHQSIAETAQSELLEEVGGVASEWRHLGHFYVANGIFNEVGHIMLARGVKLGPPSRESTEVMERHLKPIPDVLRMVRAGQIKDGPSALALFLSEPHLLNLLDDAG
jgi:ADP-ribose pyrophosphatase